MNEKDRRQLEAFIKPKSVAVVGASDRFGSWGSFIMKGLLSYDFPGKIFPVNRNAGTISGIKAYPDILSIPDEVELVVLAIPAESVYETINACVRKCVRGITIITSGFGEALEEGKEQEKELTRLARAHGIRLLGPNVSGTFNLHDNFNAAPSPVRFLVPSPVTAICQGGYAIYDLIASSYWRGMGVGQFIHTGNECDLKVTDFLDYFGEDPRTKAILMYLETIRDV
nr:acetyl CoA synthetase [Desulfobacterales bacterium]